MIDWLSEPVSNWLVILLFILFYVYVNWKDQLAQSRFIYISGVLDRLDRED
jgi:Flp pilus assembly protein protease CpaA